MISVQSPLRPETLYAIPSNKEVTDSPFQEILNSSFFSLLSTNCQSPHLQTIDILFQESLLEMKYKHYVLY